MAHFMNLTDLVYGDSLNRYIGQVFGHLFSISNSLCISGCAGRDQGGGYCMYCSDVILWNGGDLFFFKVVTV